MNDWKIKESEKIQRIVNQIKSRLNAEGIDLEDYQRAMDCLHLTMAPTRCKSFYKAFIYSKTRINKKYLKIEGVSK